MARNSYFTHCTQHGCTLAHAAKGLCEKHYKEARRNNTLNAYAEKQQEDLWQFVKQELGIK